MTEAEMKIRHDIVNTIRSKLTNSEIDWIESGCEIIGLESYRKGLRDAFLISLLLGVFSIIFWLMQ